MFSFSGRNRQADSIIHMEMQSAQTKIIFKNNHKAGGLTLSDTKFHYKITIIKTVWYLYHRQLDQQNKKEGSKPDLHR